MGLFEFGDLVTYIGRRGEEVTRPELALHVQAMWRVVRDGVILVAQWDLANPPADFDRANGTWESRSADRARIDDLLAAFADHGAAAHVVESALGSGCGDLRLEFLDGCALEIYADSTPAPETDFDDEYWRLFRANADRHFVVTAHGLSS